MPSDVLRPVDRWIAVLNLILAISWARHREAAPVAGWYATTHLLAAFLPALLVRLPTTPHAVTHFLREGYPLAWLALVWGALGIRRDAGLLGEANDALVAAWDHSLFGQHLNLTWMPAMPWAWFREPMYAIYNAYYLLLVAIPLVLLWRGCPRTAREVVLRLAVTYATCFAIYAIFPVIGPMEQMPRFEGAGGGLFHAASMLVRGIGDSLGTAFPSSHTAGSLALAWLAWRRLDRHLAWGATLIAVGVCFATVYTQNHFAVDTLAGIAIAVVTQGILVPWLERGGMRLPGPGDVALHPLRSRL